MENIALYDTEQLLNATEIAHILNISRAMAYRLMQLGMIRSVSIGTAKRVRRKDLEDFILQNLVPRNSSK
jgi:excisionase family DNA binding protein